MHPIALRPRLAKADERTIGYPDTEKLGEVLLKLNETSLSQHHHDHETGHPERKITKA